MFDRQALATYLESMSFAAASLARMFRAQGREQGSEGRDPACGSNSPGSSESSARASSSSRTSPRGRAVGCAQCGPVCINLDTVRAPSLFELATSAHPIEGPESSLWPTPTVQHTVTYGRRNGVPTMALAGAVRMWPTPDASGAGSNRGGMAGREGPIRPALASAVLWYTPGASRGGPSQVFKKTQNQVTGPLNPSWVETLMGFPIGWTDIPLDQIKRKKRGSRRAQ